MDSPVRVASALTPMAWALLFFAGTSAICWVLMVLDKRRAIRGEWRIPEATLLFWAFLGGAVGGKLAQRQFRHKTTKQPFARHLTLCLLWNAVAYGAIGAEVLGLWPS